jgi:hypothetical protein
MYARLDMTRFSRFAESINQSAMSLFAVAINDELR